MRIAVNTRLLLKDKLEGIGWFTYESLKRITNNHPEHEFIFLFDRPFNKEFVFSDNVIPVVVNPSARHPILWFLFFEFGVTKALKKYKADVFISPDGWLSLRTKIRSLAVIHDLNHLHYPKFIKFSARLYYKIFFPRFAKKAQRIVTVSEFSKNDIANQYSIPLEQIDVVYNGSNSLYKPISEEEKREVRAKYAFGENYFLYVGAIHYRKNLTNLFKAFDLYKDTYKTQEKLVIVGSKKWWKGEIANTYEQMKYKSSVIFTGRLETELLSKLMGSSLALTYISFFEGFGIPIVEAFQAETAVITSNVTSMPEVAGDAAILVSPTDVREICNAMRKISNDPEYRQMLIEKGRIKKNDYSWDSTAEKFWTAIEKIL